MTNPPLLRVTQVRVLRYRMPLKRPYGTARGRTTAAVNFLVQLTAERDGQLIDGVGECQPRHALTGDGDKNRIAAWGFACAAADHLQDRTLAFDERSSAISAVRSTITELESIALEHADSTNRDRPYRGTMLGVEVALLDVVSRALGLQISELLGKKRDEIGISISTISSSNSLESVPEKVVKQARFPMTRVKGIGDLVYDLELLECAARANRSVGREKALWIDINEAMDFRTATRFVLDVSSRMASGVLPTSLVTEGMLPKNDVARLPELQRLADTQCNAAPGAGLDLRIMPDEGLWDKGDLDRLNTLGGCRAINIKAPKAGGLLASLDLANAAVDANPDVHISIGGMVGTSDITTWALHNLARALPRLDYSTSVPPSNVQARIADPLVRYVARVSNIIAPQTTPGLGTGVRTDKVAPYVEDTYDTSDASKTTGHAVQAEVEARREGIALKHGDVDLPSAHENRDLRLIRALGAKELDSYLLEREALACGLCCSRVSPLTLLAGASPERVGEIAFYHTASTLTSRAARDIVAESRYWRAVLRDAGLPVADKIDDALDRALVVNGRPVSWLRRRNGSQTDLIYSAHPELLDLLGRASTAIPGLGSVGIDLALEDHRLSPEQQRVAIVGMSLSPSLYPHEFSTMEVPAGIVKQILQGYVEQLSAMNLGEILVDVGISFASGRSPKRYYDIAKETLSMLDLPSDRIRVVESDRIDVALQGKTCCVSAISSLLLSELDECEMVELRPRVGLSGEDGRYVP